MMMSGKDFLKRHVLSQRRKVYSDWEDVTSSGRAFQVFGPATGRFGPATGKARLPTVDHLISHDILAYNSVLHTAPEFSSVTRDTAGWTV